MSNYQRTILILTLTVVFFGVFAIALAAFNPEMNFQGKLTDTNSIPVADDNYNMRFKLYTVASGGTAIWTEERIDANTVPVSSGLFTVMLGDVTGFGSISFNQTLYLGVEIGGTGTPSWDGEMTPRKKLGVVPAAFEAEKLGGKTWAEPDTIGSTTPASGAFTTLSATTSTGIALTVTQTGTDAILDLTGDSIATGTGLLMSLDALSSGSGIAIDSISTAFAGKLLNLTASGAADTTRYGVYSDLTGAGGGDSTNIAGYFSAQNATNNYGLIVEHGNVGIGTTSPDYPLEVIGMGSFDYLRTKKDVWTSMVSIPDTVGQGGGIVYTGGDYIYALRGNNSTDFWRYSISSNSWTSMTSTLANIGWNGALIYTGGDYIYTFQGGSTTFYRYSISGNSWSSMTSALAQIGGGTAGGSSAYTGGDYIYTLRGANTTDFYRYSISGNSWTSMTSTSDNINSAHSLVHTGGDFLYALRGNYSTTFYRYSISSNSWTSLASTPDQALDGYALVYTQGDYIYAFRGWGTTTFWRYSISENYWTSMATTPDAISAGASLVYTGDYIYASRGNTSTDFYRYSVGGDTGYDKLASGGLILRGNIALETDIGIIGGNVGIGTTTPGGKLSVHLTDATTDVVMFGNGTAVGSVTNATSNGTATITKTTHGLTVATGELLQITDCTTTADKGYYRIVSSTADTIVVDRALTGSDSDVDFTIYKDVITIFADDGSKGQQISHWGGTVDKPLTLGGESDWVTTGHSLTSEDIQIAGKLEVDGAVYLDSTLDVAGNVSFDGGTFVFNESGGDKDFRIEGDTDVNLFFTDASADSIGIGTSTPTGKLTVRSDSSGSVAALVRLENLATAALDTGVKIDLVVNRTTGGATIIGSIESSITNIDNTNYTGKMDFKTAASGSLTTMMEIGDPNIVMNRPLSVNVGGDVGMSYDLYFSNTGLASITSEGPLSILAGDPNHAENLTLATQGTGSVIVDIEDSNSTYGGFKVLGSSGYVLRVTPGGNVGIGDTTPDALLDFDFSSTSTTASTEYGGFFAFSDTGVVTTDTDIGYGLMIDVDRTGATGGTINTYGINIDLDADTGGTSTAYGLFVNVSGADNNYAGIFEAGSVGIGTTAPGAKLEVEVSDADNAVGLIINQNDITNNPNALNIVNTGTGTGIYVNQSSGAAGNIGWFDFASTVTSGDITGLRPRVTANAASDGANARGTYSEVIVGASKYASLAQGVMAHVNVAAGGANVTTTQVLFGQFSTGATFTGTDVDVGYLRAQTRGDETISGNYSLLALENEAVGGNGMQMDSAIRIFATNVSTPYAFDYGIDLYGATGEIATSDIRLSSGGTIGGAGGSMVIDSSGNVGIGTTGPDAILDVLDVSSPQLRLSNTDGSIYTDFQVAASTGDLTISLYPNTSADDIILNMPGGSTGTNLWVCEGTDCPSASLSGGGNLVVEGDIKYPTAGEPRRSIILTSSGAIIPTAGGAAQTKIEGTSHTYYVLDFDDSNDEAAYWHWVMPDSYDGGNINVTIYWFANTIVDSDVVWSVQTAGVDVDELYDPASLGSTYTKTDGADDVSAINELNSAEITAFSPGWAAEDEIIFRVFRDADNGSDNMTGDARFVKVKIEYSVSQEGD